MIDNPALLPIVVVGPTASGKSALSLDIGDALGGPERAEIINADAMQLYTGMDIGTAKLPVAERRGYVHHQLDVLEVKEEASVAAFQEAARRDLRDIRARGKTPVVVGGSGLYLRALLDEIEFPPTNPQTRADLEEELVSSGSQFLHRRLASLDPEAAERIEPENGRRIVRALEVIALTGRPYSASLPQYEYAIPAVQIGLTAPIEILDRRIDERAGAMYEDGLVEEVTTLIGRGLRVGKTARRATGYAQALHVIDGRMTLAEAAAETAAATRRLARKQLKWFRRDPRVTWVDTSQANSADEALSMVIAAFGA